MVEGRSRTRRPQGRGSTRAPLPRFVVFDVGGVLIRWDDALVMDEAAKELGRSPQDLREELLRHRPALQSGRTDVDGFWDLVARDLEVRVPRRVRDLWWELLERKARPRWEVVRWAARLRAHGLRTPLFSNTDASHGPFFSKTWAEGFEPRLLSYELGAVKPRPAAFIRARARLGVPPSNVCLLDDVPSNVEAARRQGWNAHLFTEVGPAERHLRWMRWLSSP